MKHSIPPAPNPPSGLGQGAGQRLSVLAAYAARPFPSLDEAINETLELLADLIGIGLTMIHRLEGGNLVVSHACDRIGLGITTPIAVPREHTFCDTVLKSLVPLVVRDADADPHWRALPGKLLVGTRSYASVPIVLGNGRVFGTLCAHDRRVLDLGPAEIDAMRILARLIASQIERDDALHKEADTARSLEIQNEELSRALHQLDALREAVESISSELKIEALLDQVLANAVALLGAHAGAISLVGETPDAPRRFVATHNLDIEDLGRRDIPARVGLMGTIMARQGPVIVERYEGVDQPLPDAEFHHLAPWIGVPIWWHDAIIGTFGIAAKDPRRAFGERDIAVLSILARHAAVGIENARLYAASRELGIAEERNRLAREIHDTLAQSLLTLTFQLRAARGLIAGEPERALQGMIEAEANARAALDEARRSVWNLGPASLAGGSLVEALQGEVDPRRAGVPCRLAVAGSTRPLPAEVQLALLRVTQEAIANARQHAACTRVEVLLEYGADAVSVSIRDNGQGFDPERVHPAAGPGRGFGLAGMAERLQSVGGRLEVRSGPRYGPSTTIFAIAPFPAVSVGQMEWSGRKQKQHERLNTLRVVIVDDHLAIRAGLAALLEAETDMVVVGQASTGEEGLRLIAALAPDVALVDLQLPTIGGVETIGRMARLGSRTRAIVVTSFAQDELVLEALRAGAQGYLLKDATARELTTAVRAVGGGGTYLTPKVAGTLATALRQPERLTRRERQVLRLIGRGLADKEIASELGTSAKTAQFHVANLLAKLGAQNRTDAVRIAYARGLLGVVDEGGEGGKGARRCSAVPRY